LEFLSDFDRKVVATARNACRAFDLSENLDEFDRWQRNAVELGGGVGVYAMILRTKLASR